jgi:signal transduction histidine kinase
MRKSIFAEFFYLCSAIIFAAVICIGAVLILVSIENFKIQQRNRLVKISDETAAITIVCCLSDNVIDTNELSSAYKNAATTCDADFALVDSNGKTLAYSKESPCALKKGSKSISGILKAVGDDGYFSVGTLGNYYEKSYFTFIFPVDLNGTKYYLFSTFPVKSFTDYVLKLVLFFFAAATSVVVFVVLPSIYFAIKRLLGPVKDMTLAARRFGEGDFSQKLYIAQQNELGYLANSLNEMASSLQALDDNRRSFVSNVSHEFKTPLTTIGGFVDGMLDGTIPKDMHRHYLKIVSEEVDRLSRLVRSMLNISKYESGELKMSTECFDIVPITAKTVFLFENKINVKEVDIRGLDADRFIVNADKDLIQQVIYNLVENAVKFVNNGGYISFDYSQNENFVTVRIRNSGQGLKEHEISRVFDRFYKADESRGIDKSGVGLGLSIVSSIIKLHGGTILVRSEWGEFVEFEFTLARGYIPQNFKK